MEVNASDDRSPEAFLTQLEAATQMRAVMGKDPKPNCLVLDEIDGAPSVRFLSGEFLNANIPNCLKNLYATLIHICLY